MATETPLLDSLPVEHNGQLVPAGALVSAGAPEEELLAPTTPQQLRRSRGFLAPAVIDGYVDLGPSLETTNQLRVLSPQEAQAKGEPYASISGRLQTTGSEIGTKVTGGAKSHLAISTLYSGWMPGHVYIDKEAAKAKEACEYSVFDTLNDEDSFAFAVFEHNPNAAHPFSLEFPAVYGKDDIGDWELRDVITSDDANPTNGHFKSLKGWLDRFGHFSKTDSGGEPMLQYGLLSDIGAAHETRLNKRFGSGYRNEIDKLMLAFYQQYVEGRPTKVSHATKELMEEYKTHCPSIFDWRIPARGWAKKLALDDFRKGYRKEFKQSMPSDVKDQLDIQMERSRKEVIQALAMSQLTFELGRRAVGIAKTLGAPPDALPDPVAWHIRGIDSFDHEFSDCLTNIYRSPKTMEEAGEAKEVAGIAAMQKQLKAVGANLIIEPTRGNVLFKDNKPHEGAIPYNNTVMRPRAPRAATALEIFASLYDPYGLKGLPNLMGGVVCYLTAKNSHAEDSKDFLVMDLKEGPAGIIRHLNERLDLFNSTRQGIPRNHFLSGILLNPPKRESLTIVTTTPDGKHTTQKEVTEKAATISTFDPDKREVVFHNAHTRPTLKAIKAANKAARKTGVSVARVGRISKERKVLRKKHVVVPDKPIPKNHINITNVALQNNAAHVRDGRGQQSTVMPSPAQ
ncbi:MAG TPA: hypothetical protein VK674_06670 [Candidatus Limnocylindria bacterium]|nr:hypothetical protein [Candidatus Limnocylindria bacterium]